VPTLKELREAKGMTQKELAERLGVAVNTIYRWETAQEGANAFTPRGPARRLLGIVFGVDPETITYGAAITGEANERSGDGLGS
jgi:transcriptional regulator with XRE-family HTH domain